jgi:hypothetical protein
MPILPRNTPSTSSRAVTMFTLGTGPTKPPVSTAATAPNLATLAGTPPRLNVIGVDSQMRTVAVPALAKGASATVSVAVPLPALPSALAAQTTPPSAPASPVPILATRNADRVRFTASAFIAGLPFGLVLTSTTIVPQARSGSQSFNGPVLPGGQPYSAFTVLCTFVVTAQADAAAGTASVTTNGTLTFQSG